MNYNKIYASIVLRAQYEYDARKALKANGAYYEFHHIIPKSLGGSDALFNRALLTAKEHFICHWLLVKIYPIGTPERHKMLFAFWCMQQNGGTVSRAIFSRAYEKLRHEYAKLVSERQRLCIGEKNGMTGAHWYTNIDTGESGLYKNEPSNRWVLGKDIFNHKSRIWGLWSIATKKPRTIKHGKVCPDLVTSFKKRESKNREWTELNWNLFHSSDYKSLNQFCKSDAVGISVVAMTKRFIKYIPIYTMVSSQGKTFKPDRKLVNVFT